VARRLSLILVVAALAAAGCMTTAARGQNRLANEFPEIDAGASGARPQDALPAGKPPEFARLQSPADERAGADASAVQLPQPALPDAGLPSTSSDATPIPSAPLEVNQSTDPPPILSAFPPDDSPALTGDSPALRGLSSISRNRRINRMRAAALPDSSSMLDAAAAGRLPSGATSRTSGMSSILRNRIEAEGEPAYNYPDIHADPAKIYHDRFGIDEDHDRFVLPWLMNLIFEDRWLLSERDPTRATQNQFRRRMKVDIRDPDPDTANFPNGAYTLPKGRLYIESSPVGLYGASNHVPRIYQWDYLVRYGMTDNLEFRIFSNGLTAKAAQGKMAATTGVSPLAFDFKANFWEEDTRYHIPAMGLEVYIQTTFGSPAFNSGTQPSMSLLFDQSLPFGINFEYNFGITGVENGLGFTHYQFGFQWAFQRQVVKDFDIFVQGFYNEAALPRLIQFRDVRHERMLIAEATIPTVAAAGVGAIWTINNRLAIFGSYNFGLNPASPRTIALLGGAVAF
jgi:hypothetical protein